MCEVLEDVLQLLVFLISCYDFTYQALRTIIHSEAAKAFFILSFYEGITYRSISGRNSLESYWKRTNVSFVSQLISRNFLIL